MNVTGTSDRSRLLNLLSDVKAKIADNLGVVDFPIPQFIIVGKQSVGKSRLIEALAGEQFNFVSGTLGSRRPTVLEFRHIQKEKSSWYIRDESNNWQQYPINRIVQLVGDAHESLGASVSAVPIYVRVESPHCVDMQVVDLPGFRDFSLDNQKADLATQIEELVTSFMNDSRNVMVCVEQAGDAANMSTLARCQRLDPNYKRTILVRNKLDKFYNDLSFQNINEWIEGFGDLPPTLPKFTLTLPHWTEKGRNGEVLPPPAPFVQLRKQMSDKDNHELKSKGAASMHLEFIGFDKFAKAMEIKIEQMFADAIGPIVRKLKDMELNQVKKLDIMVTEMKDTNSDTMLRTVRDAGKSFAQALVHVMEGVVTSEIGRQTLPEEMEEFEEYVTMNNLDVDLMPSKNHTCMDDYLEFLCNEMHVPAWDLSVNGGAQYRRLLLESEIYVRMMENEANTSRVDVVQARGVSLGSVTWHGVILKLLANQAHLPMKRRMQYVAARLKFCFSKQGEVALEFMRRVAGAPDQHMYSTLFTKNSRLIDGNPLIRRLILDAFSDAIEKQAVLFESMYAQTLKATFANPFAFLSKGPVEGQNIIELLDDTSLKDIVDFEVTKTRVPEEMEQRGSIEEFLNKWLIEVPNEPSRIEEAVSKVQVLLNYVFGAIRAQLADTMELYAESFFKMAVMHKVEENMSEIEMGDSDKDAYKGRRQVLKEEVTKLEDGSKAIKECLEKLQSFSLQTRAVKQV